jgi:protein-tyrosine phosphatase
MSIIREKINHIFNNIYLGDANAAYDKEILGNYNIQAIVQAIPVTKPDNGIETYLIIPINDHPAENLLQYISEFYNFMEKNQDKNILIHCMAGISRSASLVIAWLMYKFDFDLDTAFTYVKAKRSIINPNPGFIEQLKKLNIELKKIENFRFF